VCANVINYAGILEVCAIEFSFTNTICALSRNMSDMIDEGDIPDILLSQIAEMMECEAKAPDISHMDLYTMKSTIFS
jgi:hypothetical protein